MTEEQKIRQTIEQYSSYFEHSDADVGHTQKGVWFFYEYDKEHDYYNSFIRFETAKELEHLKNMETLNGECRKWAERLDVIYGSFSGVLERLQDKN